jgi:hypothetical protein
MWEPRPLATLGASMACNRDSFTFTLPYSLLLCILGIFSDSHFMTIFSCSMLDFFLHFILHLGVLVSLYCSVWLSGDMAVCDKLRLQFQSSQVWDQLNAVLIFFHGTFLSLFTKLWTWFRANFKVYTLSAGHHTHNPTTEDTRILLINT